MSESVLIVGAGEDLSTWAWEVELRTSVETF